MNRKEKILEILREKKETSVKELSKIFGVSEMTIYRDVRELEQEGHVKRKHGAVLINDKEESESLMVDTCPICDKPITRAYPYRITIEDTKVVETCCEHCGFLLHSRYEDKKVSAITYDFITENPISALNAWYVVGSSAVPCCSPSVIPFASKEDAEKFSKGFGGQVMSFIDAYNTIVNNMNINLKSCCHPQETVFRIDQLKKKS
ncbi:DeoR family transcriptional regulator [Persephonella sp. KM09-Lau-8]|uniref:DeoR family transcriptional regulator n=1 Tax=Persephonella sp. KM09-Lau-8 TaxID=1158345 RepID=UPI00049634D3|nr:DeoR family transcriptional regulator [Persephonella sp. KM09-Lau-8]